MKSKTGVISGPTIWTLVQQKILKINLKKNYLFFVCCLQGKLCGLYQNENDLQNQCESLRINATLHNFAKLHNIALICMILREVFWGVVFVLQSSRCLIP